jgi:hypothetical protein
VSAYLSQIAAGAFAAVGSRGTLSPAIRSRSPIAERDQRLTLTDMDWNFEDNLGSEAAAIKPAEPMEPATRIEPAIPEQIPAKSVPHPSSPNPAIEEFPPERPDLRHQAQLTSTSNSPRIPHPLVSIPISSSRRGRSFRPCRRRRKRRSSQMISASSASRAVIRSPRSR